jgi:hypothetical protein
MVDAKATLIVLFQWSRSSLHTKPLRFPTTLDRKQPPCGFNRTSRFVCKVLDLKIKIIIVCSNSHRIFAQCICIGVLHTWSMYDLETEILEHVDPTSPSSICIRHRCQPFQWLMICSQNKVGAMQILPKVHDAPNQCITFPFHGVELLLNRCQSLTGVRHNSFLPAFLLRQDGTDSLQ